MKNATCNDSITKAEKENHKDNRLNPQNLITEILAKEPYLYGKSRIQVVTTLMESECGNESPMGEETYPLPDDLWDWVLAPDRNPKPLGEPGSLKDHQLQQAYLGTRASHFRPLWGFHLTAKSRLRRLTKRGWDHWKPELLPALSFWATHPTNPSAEAGYLLMSAYGASGENLLQTLRANQNFRAQIVAESQLTPTQTLRGLGWDVDAHKDGLEWAAKRAVEIHKELASLEKHRQESDRAQLEIYQALLRSSIPIKSLKLPPKLQAQAERSRKFYKQIDGMLQGKKEEKSTEELIQDLQTGLGKLESRNPKKSYDGAFDICSPQRERGNDWQIVLHHSAFPSCPHRTFRGPNLRELLLAAIHVVEKNTSITP